MALSSLSFGQVLVRAGEDLLEDVLGVGRGQPVRLNGDRVDVAREALDELAPGIVVACAAAGDELCVRFGNLHCSNQSAHSRSEQDSNGQPGRAAVHGDERPRDFEIDVDGARDLHRVLELVSVLDELAEAPGADVELLLRSAPRSGPALRGRRGRR